MAQKNKVKELVGRGLDSYHTKSLQQMDRIEKKNKEQNHKISILSNELDNDYLTKTEEGSVISLEHSKEGMIYLDELQGNTLVNYCTDGSKEMTLNGDIDVEGTFVTTTEGVDNGLVDIMCEGNTLINLIKIDTSEYKTIGHASSNTLALGDASLFRNGIQYTIICEFSDIVGNARVCFNFNSGGSAPDIYVKPTQGLVKHTFTMPTEPTIKTNAQVRAYYFDQENSCKIKNLIIFEGDWTNKEIPSYFVGMKSVGQDDVNGHKIEILSQTQNLVDDFSKYKKINSSVTFTKINNHSFSVEGNGEHTWQQVNFNIPFIQNAKAGDTFTLFAEEITLLNQDISSDIGIQMRNTTLNMSISNSWQVNANKPIRNGLIKFTIPNNYNGTDILDLRVHVNHGVALANKVTIKNLMIAKGHVDISSFKPYGLNKKEILMNEPLRAIDNVKDRIVKIDGKYFIERNTKQIIIDNNTPLQNSTIEGQETCKKFMIGLEVFSDRYVCNAFDSFAICDTLPTLIQSERTKDVEFVSPDGWNTNMFFSIKRSKLQGDTVADIKTYLQQNPMKLVYRLATPIYEPLEVEPTLSTYNDITHISNNSIIPCNMKIKNTGYNAIIKPSTLYTVAIGTNKGGTVGVNLGGTKGTTTNNALKLTTPATLSDDSLRIYGKGLKGSKVRLFEGDIINIPKHFTGMQSSFEDKVQTDGSYKVEVLSNNENLFRLEDIKYSTSAGNSARPIKNGFKIITDTVNYWHAVVSMELNVKPKTTYTLGVSKKVVINAYPSQEPSWGAGYVFIREYGDKVLTEGKVKDNTRTYFRFNSGENTKIRVTFATATDVATQKGEYDFTDLDLRESKSNLEYVGNKYNKIQFSSIKPLRSVGTAKDKLVFINNEFKIERNVGSYTINGTESWYYALDPAYANHNNIYFRTRNLVNDKKTLGAVRNDKLPNYINDILWSIDKMGFGTNDQYFVNGFCIRLPRRIVGNGTRAEMETNCKEWLSNNNLNVVYELAEPTYEEIPFELQKIILEGYENGTLFLDTNIPPTATVTYAGETPIVKATKLNKTEVLNNTEDINDNIIPYLMDMDYRVVMLQLVTEELEGGVSMARLFGGTYEMIKRDILSKRLTREEYGYRLADYYNAGKLTEEQVRELEELR